MEELKRQILDRVMRNLHLVGVKITADAKREALAKVYDKGNFYRGIGYMVRDEGNLMQLTVGSNVRHEPFVLGGKKPSWTPLAPIKSWVERKGLSWVDDSGKLMDVEQIAWAIIGKIKREGIEPRNIFKEIIDADYKWIMSTLSA